MVKYKLRVDLLNSVFVGYGARYITNNCKIGVVILMAQCGCSVILQSLMGG
jgi:hypothetical protein